MLRHRRHRNTAPGHDPVPAWFDSQILEDPHLDTWFLYVIFTETPDGMGLLKVGVTQSPLERVQAIRQGSPLPLKAAIFCEAGNKKVAFGIEAGIHALFKQRRTRGEWFRFDYADPTDKQCFHQGTKTVYTLFTKRQLSWAKVSEAVLKEGRHT